MQKLRNISLKSAVISVLIFAGLSLTNPVSAKVYKEWQVSATGTVSFGNAIAPGFSSYIRRYYNTNEIKWLRNFGFAWGVGVSGNFANNLYVRGVDPLPSPYNREFNDPATNTAVQNIFYVEVYDQLRPGLLGHIQFNGFKKFKPFFQTSIQYVMVGPELVDPLNTSKTATLNGFGFEFILGTEYEMMKWLNVTFAFGLSMATLEATYERDSLALSEAEIQENGWVLKSKEQAFDETTILEGYSSVQFTLQIGTVFKVHFGKK